MRLAPATIALLPIRFFFGATFLWAGLDKLLDPAFLDPAAAGSLHAQLVVFARFSPLQPLIEATLPFTVLIGLVIAVAEIGIGIGALTGLAFRVAAAGGMLLSLLFWLTASWATHPYYFGADLPYAIGWMALAIAGHANVLVPARFADRPDHAGLNAPRRDAALSPERRLMLQTATLAGIAAVVASLTLPLRAVGLLAGPPQPSPQPSPGPSPGPSPTPLSSPGATVQPGSVPVASAAAVAAKGAFAFTIPFDAPTPLPAGDPGVIVQLADGTFAAFDTVCTHAGCTVEWDSVDRVLICPCHEATFDAEHGAAVLGGPAPAPLTSLPISIDAATGTIFLVARG